jgi:hypothetical protein
METGVVALNHGGSTPMMVALSVSKRTVSPTTLSRPE